MQQLNHTEEMMVNQIIAREFIEDKLGIEATPENVSLFVAYITSYEDAVEKRKRKLSHKTGKQQYQFFKQFLDALCLKLKALFQLNSRQRTHKNYNDRSLYEQERKKWKLHSV